MSARIRQAAADFDGICARIQAVIGRDVGSRGIANLTLPAQLQTAALHLVVAPAVVILTGFPCRVKEQPPTETDGPPGAVALAAAARALGKRTAIATDESSAAVMRACIDAWPAATDVKLLAFPPVPAWTASDAERLQTVARDYHHAIAIERAGRAADGTYRTMRAISMDGLVAPLDELLTIGAACGGEARPWRTSTGIGDGGNECGMGIVRAAVAAHVPRGDVIGCVVPCDALLAAGVSNWGGWGLVAAAEALVRIAARGDAARDAAPGADSGSGASLAGEAAIAGAARALTAATSELTLDQEACRRVCASAPGSMLPSDAAEGLIAAAMEAAGARDGITGAAGGSVDGMPPSVHLGVLTELRSLLHDAFPC